MILLLMMFTGQKLFICLCCMCGSVKICIVEKMHVLVCVVACVFIIM